MARAVGHRLGAAARGHQPPDAERGLGAAALARAAHALPAELHPDLRGPGLVPAAAGCGRCCSPRSASWPGCWSTTSFHFDLPVQLGVFLPGLFLACFFCHGELYRLRPAAERLTAFYLTVSAGGALGGAAGGGGRAARLQRLLRARRRRWSRSPLLAALRFAALSLVARIASLAVLLGVAAGAAYDGFSRPAGRARRHAQLLRRAAREGVRRAGRGVAPAPPGARHDHARRAVPAREPAPAADHLLRARPRASASPSRRGRTGRCASASSAWAPAPSPPTAAPATSTASTRSTRDVVRDRAQRVHLPLRQRGEDRGRARRRAPDARARAAAALRRARGRRLLERRDPGAPHHARGARASTCKHVEAPTASSPSTSPTASST